MFDQRCVLDSHHKENHNSGDEVWPVKGALFNQRRRYNREYQHGRDLSKRHIELIQHLADDLTVSDAAKLMGISYHTADHHIRVIRARLGVRTHAAMVAAALRRGLID